MVPPSCRVVLEVAIGLLIGDLVVALVHFLEDNYVRYDPRRPWYLTWLNEIAINDELHHHAPRIMTGSTYWDNMEQSVLAWAAASVGLFAIPHSRRFLLRHLSAYIAASVVLCTANLMHRFAHERDNHRPAFATLLQKYGIVEGREQHRLHHTGNPDRMYGSFLSFTGPIYDRMCIGQEGFGWFGTNGGKGSWGDCGKPRRHPGAHARASESQGVRPPDRTP